MRKKETVIENITFIALMAAINVVFVLLDLLTGGFSLFVLFVLPLASVFTFLFCKGKYFLIYLIATLSLTGLIDFQLTLFYILPAAVSGAVFGIFIKAKIPISYTLITATFVQVFFSTLALPLIDFFYEVNMVETISNILNLAPETAKMILPGLLCLISFIQIALTYLVIESEIKKIGIPIKKDLNPLHYIFGILGFSILIIAFSFFYIGVSFALLPFVFFMGGQLLFTRLGKHNYWIILVIIIIDVFLFAFISGNVSVIHSPIYTFLFPASLAIHELIFYQLQKYKKDITISKERSDV